MSAPRPTLAASERTAARLLDIQPKKFRELVGMGALPPPIRIADLERWRVDDLVAILEGRAARPADDEDIEI